MKNLKHIFTFALLFFRVGGSICARKKSLPLANEEYADKFVDADYSFKFKIPK
jgi:hypothetical protein